MGTQGKRQFSVRLPADLVAWADGYGRARRWDRTTVIVAALEALRGGAVVPGLEEESAAAVRDAGTKSAARAASVAGGQQSAVASASPRAVDPRFRRQPTRDLFATSAAFHRALAAYEAKGDWTP